MKPYTVFLFWFITFLSCGPKVSKDVLNKITESQNYQTISNLANNLVSKSITGEIIAENGRDNIGTYTRTFFYEPNSNELIKVENKEVSTVKVIENYYYKNGEFYTLSIKEEGKKKTLNMFLDSGSKPNNKNKYTRKALRFLEEFRILL